MLFDSSPFVSMNKPIIPSSSLGYSPPDVTKKHGDYRPLAYSGHESVSGWISWWDHQFANNLDLIDDYSKTQIATQYLESKAATWYASLKEAYHSPPLWQDFKRAIVVMFANVHPVVPPKVTDHVLRPGTVTNNNTATTTNATATYANNNLDIFHPGHARYSSDDSDHDTLNVADYTSRFFKSNVDPLPEETLLQRYISGLRPELQREITAKRPRSVSEAVIFATNAENGRKWPANSNMFGDSRPNERRSPLSVHHTSSPDHFSSMPRPLPVTAPYFTPGTFPSVAAAKTPVGPAASQKYGLTYAENLHKLTTEERERLRRLGGCFRCRQLGHQKDQCPLLEMGNNVVPPPGINFALQSQDDPSLNNIPKLTTEERDRLRKFGGCYRCRRLGHQKEDCPMNQTHPSMTHELDMLSSTSSASDTDDTADTVNFAEDIANVVLKET